MTSTPWRQKTRAKIARSTVTAALAVCARSARHERQRGADLRLRHNHGWWRSGCAVAASQTKKPAPALDDPDGGLCRLKIATHCCVPQRVLQGVQAVEFKAAQFVNRRVRLALQSLRDNPMPALWVSSRFQIVCPSSQGIT